MITSKLKFDCFPGLHGKFESNNIELTVTGPQSVLQKLTKYLTVTDKGVLWQVNHLKKAVKRHECFIAKCYTVQFMNAERVQDAREEARYNKAKQKVVELKAQIAELVPNIKKEYYGVNDNGSINIPSGFYYLCETIENNHHLNTEIPTYIVPGCREYQEEMIREMMKRKRATGVLATGLGKSRIIASLALSAVQANKKAMVIVPTAYLVGQMFFYLKTLYDKVHAIGGTFGQRPVGDAKILVTTMDSAIKHVDSFEMIAVDESHHTSATTWFETLCNARSATHVYNVTATPFRQDGLDIAIHAFGGPTVYERDVRWGIEHNWLARPKITQILLQCYRIPFMSNSNLKMFDSIIPEMKAYSSIIRSPEALSFLRAKVKMCLDKGRRVIVIFKTVKAGEVFRQYCKGYIDFSVASATTKKSRYPLDAFRRGETNLLVSNVKLISEGLDIPDASILFNVVQNSGDVATLQMSGRVLRISPNKPEPVIFDIQLSSYEKFERAAASRREIYEKMTGQAVEYFVR